MNNIAFPILSSSPGNPRPYRFPEDFPGAENDAQVIGYWRSSFSKADLHADHILVSNLIRDHNPGNPMLFQVPEGRMVTKIAQGPEAVKKFFELVNRASISHTHE